MIMMISSKNEVIIRLKLVSSWKQIFRNQSQNGLLQSSVNIIFFDFKLKSVKSVNVELLLSLMIA